MEPNPDPRASAPRRVEAYLDQILAPLALREHLWARVAAYRELGHLEDEAVTEALRQFGGAEDFLRQWRREWMKTTPQATLREVWQATCYALLFSSPALLMTCPDSVAWWREINVSHFAWAPEWMRACGIPVIASGWGSFAFDFALLPIAFGAAVGRFTPRCAAVGTLAALAMEVALTDPFMWRLPGEFLNGMSYQVFTCTVAWLPLACTTAALTGWWARRSETRRLA